ncbi:MAG: SEL1-like repeat protein [Alphaproteobacteria bacterium]|nr:SEL1-like repeat protein [Alphaproteobacteria bacterium]
MSAQTSRRRAVAAVFAAGALLLPAVALADYASGLAAYERRDFAKAYQEWRTSAEQGDARAQLGLGILFDAGQGVAENPGEAGRWYAQAADKGVVTALYNLGRLFNEGRGVPRDIDRAKRLWQMAADAGSAPAAHNLAVVSYAGIDGAQDFATAARWFARAADAGYPESQYMLGELYRLGLGVTADGASARKYLQLAELQGHARAAERLKSMAAEAPATEAPGAQLPGRAPAPPGATSRPGQTGGAPPPQLGQAQLARPGTQAPAQSVAQAPLAAQAPAQAQPGPGAAAAQQGTRPASVPLPPAPPALPQGPGATQSAAAPPAQQPLAPAAAPGSPAEASAPGAPLPRGSVQRWVASFSSLDRAQSQWNGLATAHRDLLAQTKPVYRQVTLDGTPFFRLLVIGFQSPQQAETVCTELRRRGALSFCKVERG